MPDNSYDDDAVEDTYVHLSQLCKNGRKLWRRIVIAGDWNAVVGSRREADEDSIGMHAAGLRNARGEWMVNWVTSQTIFRILISAVISKTNGPTSTNERSDNSIMQ